jgi:membrane protein
MATIRLRGLGYVVVLGLMLLVSMVLSTGLKLASDWAGTVLPIAPLGQVMLVVNELVSFAVSVALFWGVMRLGSGPNPRRVTWCSAPWWARRCSPWANRHLPGICPLLPWCRPMVRPVRWWCC